MDVDEIKQFSWPLFFKGLSFEGGPSSTKFVYMASCVCVMSGALLLLMVVCGVYIGTKDHHVDGSLVSLIGILMASVGGMAANSVNQRRKVIAASAAKDCKDVGPSPTN